MIPISFFSYIYKRNCHLLTDDLRGETMVPPSKKLDDLIHLAELCVDLLQQNEEHYAEVNGSLLLQIKQFFIFKKRFKINLHL